MYAVDFLPSAARELASLERAMQHRVARRIGQLAEDPRGGGAVKLRGGDAVWRARVGDYRLLYRINDDGLVVLIISFGHRRDVYR